MPTRFSLHVLPPAFSLPSIDAECLAAVAYLTWALPRPAWTLIAESGLESEPLPCLRDAAGKTTVVGFDAIVRYLREQSHGQWDLDASLNKMQRADCTAFTSHLTQTLSPLVDLSLYICAENYDTTTRAAYGATLNFPESWVIPPERHKVAKERTSHLGFDPADLYNPDPRPSPTRSSRSNSSSPPVRAFDAPSPPTATGYFGTRGRSLANHAVTSARLTALIEEALQPLATLHESTGCRYLLGDTPTTLDCHALALLALALLPSLSNPFLATGFAKFPGLEKYTRSTIRAAFGPPVTASDALIRAPLQEEVDEDDFEFDSYETSNIGSDVVKLPWRRAKRSILGITQGVARAVMA